MGFIPPALFALAKSHPLVFHQLHPISRATIGVSSSTTASAPTAALGPVLAAIVKLTIKEFIHIRFTVAHNLCFIVSSLKIWEQMGFYKIEEIRSVVRVLG